MIFTGCCHHINGVMRAVLRHLQFYKETRTHIPIYIYIFPISLREGLAHADIRRLARTDAYTCRSPYTEWRGKERKVDRTGQRAEIKGRRGDEFVKKAEAGQQHASRTSKRQDEMKSNRCPSPPRLETLLSSPLFSSRDPRPPFLYPFSFLTPDFLLRRLRHAFFPLLFAFSAVFGTSHPLRPTPLQPPPTPLTVLASFLPVLSFSKQQARGGRAETEPWKRARKPFTRPGGRSVHRAYCFSRNSRIVRGSFAPPVLNAIFKNPLPHPSGRGPE